MITVYPTDSRFKGRNGYAIAREIEVNYWETGVGIDGAPSLSIEIHSKRRADVAPCLLDMSLIDAKQLAEALQEEIRFAELHA